MSLSPHQARVLREISEQLAVSDPRLARRLSEPVQPPMSTVRELAVMAVLLCWTALGALPLTMGIAYSLPMLVGVGVLTAFVAAPMLIWATLRWVPCHGFVRFRDSDPP
jgi:hypothetical protein